MADYSDLARFFPGVTPAAQSSPGILEMFGGGLSVPGYGQPVNSVKDAGAMSALQLMGNPGVSGQAAGALGGLGLNIPTGQLALGGLGALGNLWGAFQAQGLAQKQFELTRNIANTNLTNQIRSYNTALEDRARSRGAVEGQSQSQVDDYLARNRMTR